MLRSGKEMSRGGEPTNHGDIVEVTTDNLPQPNNLTSSASAAAVTRTPGTAHYSSAMTTARRECSRGRPTTRRVNHRSSRRIDREFSSDTESSDKDNFVECSDTPSPRQRHSTRKPLRYNRSPSRDNVCARPTVLPPPFDPDHIKMWLRRLNDYFCLVGIKTSVGKYRHCVSMLSVAQAIRMNAYLDDQSDNPFQRLEEGLIKVYGLKPDAAQSRLLNLTLASTTGPADLMSRMQNIIDETADSSGEPLVSRTFLRRTWLQRLPSTIRAACMAVKTLPLDQLVEHAQEVYELTDDVDPNFHCNDKNAREDHRTPSPVTSHMSNVSFHKYFSDLNTKIDDMARNKSSSNGKFPKRQVHFNDTSRSARKSRSPSPAINNRNSDDINSGTTNLPCYYHAHFGKRAKKCAGKSCPHAPTPENYFPVA